MNVEGQHGGYLLALESSTDSHLESYIVTIGNSNDRVILTPIGKEAISRDPQILAMGFVEHPGREYLIWDSWITGWMRPGLRSQIFRNRIHQGVFDFIGQEIAIKQPLDTPEGRDSTAIEQLIALEALRSVGFSVVPTLFATERTNRLVSLWCEGSHPDATMQAQLDRYLSELNQSIDRLIQEGEWNSDWGHVDRQPGNYFVDNLESSDVRQHFTVLDPISRTTIIIW